MGARENAPPMPDIEATLLPESDLSITFMQRECNWLQALEGDIDTSHFNWLHVGSVQPEQVDPDNWLKYQVSNRRPTTSDGYRLGHDVLRLSSGRGRQDLLAVRAFRLPVLDLIPQGDFMDRVIARAWVPMDDTHAMWVGFTRKRRRASRRWRAAT